MNRKISFFYPLLTILTLAILIGGCKTVSLHSTSSAQKYLESQVLEKEIPGLTAAIYTSDNKLLSYA